MKVLVPEASAAVTVNGTSTGYITVASDTPFYVGAECWLKNNAGSQRCVIVDLPGSGLIGLRFLAEENLQGARQFPAPNYGRSNCSAYTVATSSKLWMPSQWVSVNPQFTKPTV